MTYQDEELRPRTGYEKMIVGCALRKLRGQVLEELNAKSGNWEASTNNIVELQVEYRKPGWVYTCR